MPDSIWALLLHCDYAQQTETTLKLKDQIISRNEALFDQGRPRLTQERALVRSYATPLVKADCKSSRANLKSQTT